MRSKLQKYWKKQGFRQFCIKTLVFLGFIVLLPLATFKLVLLTTPPRQFLPFFLTIVGQGFIFALVAFLIISRNKLLKLKKFVFSWWQAILFIVLSLASLAGFFALRFYVFNNYEIALQNHALIIIGMLLAVLAWLIFLALTVYNLAFIRHFASRLKKELAISAALFACSYILFTLIQKLWQFFSYIVTVSVGNLFMLFRPDVVMRFREGGSPLLGAGRFIASVGEPCSGVDSLVLFAGIYGVIAAYDWKILNKKKLAALFIPGLVGMFAFNILRVFLLMAVGVYYSPQFAIGMFHSNIGWILFVVYSLLFWWLAYRYIKK